MAEQTINMSNGSAKLSWRDLWKIISVIILGAVIAGGYMFAQSEKIITLGMTKLDKKEFYEIKEVLIKMQSSLSNLEKNFETHVNNEKNK